MTTHPHPAARRSRLRPALLAAAIPACLLLSAAPAQTLGVASAGGGFCSATASQQFAACQFELGDDLFKGRAICMNIADEDERGDCFKDLNASQREGRRQCGDQLGARKELCSMIGEARYDPPLKPSAFDSDFRKLAHPNPYQPLGIGYRWMFVGEGQTVEVEIQDKTKRIAGIHCIVSHDQVREDDSVVEDTNDWFAHAKNGDVYYCGEESAEFETFAGDHPREPELVDIGGSFKWGRDGDQGGLLVPIAPRPGMSYRQELSLGNAEDFASVVAIDYRYGRYPALDRHVPRKLAQKLCSAGDCLVTKEGTTLEPDALEYKYYAAGIGVFLEVDVRSGGVSQLVACNFDARCDDLPMP